MAVSYVGAGALAHSTTGAISVAMPAGWTTGDLLLIVFASASESYSPPTGFVTAKAANCGGVAGASNTAFINVAYKIADGSEVSPIALPGTSGNHRMAQMLAYRGVDTVTPLVTSEAINNNTGTTAAASLTLPSLGPNTAKNAIPFFAAAFATNVNGVWTSTTSVNERVDNGTTDGNASAIVVSDWAGINDMGGPGGTVGPPSATITPGSSTQIAAVGLMIYPIATQAVVIVANLGSVTGAAAIKNKDGVAVAGVLSSITGTANLLDKNGVAAAGLLSSVTGTAAVKNKDGVAVAGLLGSVTGTAAVSNRDGVAIAAVLAAITGAAEVSNRTGTTITGVLGSIIGAVAVANRVGAAIAGDLGSVTGTVAVFNKDGVAIAGVLGPIIGAVDVVLSQLISVDGLLGAITGEVNLLDKDGVAIAGVLGAIEGAADIALGQGVSVAGVLGSILGAVNVTLTNTLTLDGLLGAITGNVVVDNRNHVLVAATLGAVTGHGAVTIGNTDCYDLMADKRELILARLEVLLSGLGRAKRNDPDAPEGLRPAYMVLDGDEDTEALLWGHGRPSDQKHIIDMHPEVYYVTGGTDPALVGREMNEAAAGIIHAVLNDSTLLSYTLNGRGAVRSGLRSSVDPGRQVEGSLAVDFDFTYVFQPAELCSVLPLPVGPWLPDEPPRERILAAIARALAACPGVTTFKRNEIVTSEHALTAVMMLDGDEVSEPPPNNSRPANGPAIVDLQPEVYVIVAGDPAAVGPALNVMHQMLLRAVLTDALVTSLVHSKVVKYEGLQTGLSLGRSMAGEMGFKFVTQYMLTP